MSTQLHPPLFVFRGLTTRVVSPTLAVEVKADFAICPLPCPLPHHHKIPLRLQLPGLHPEILGGLEAQDLCPGLVLAWDEGGFCFSFRVRCRDMRFGDCNIGENEGADGDECADEDEEEEKNADEDKVYERTLICPGRHLRSVRLRLEN
jgi:hypothetical protein